MSLYKSTRNIETEFDSNIYTNPINSLVGNWEDTSWHNDENPSFENKELKLKVWVLPTSIEDRQYEDEKQFYLCKHDECEDEFDDLAEFEELDELNKYILNI